MGLSWWLVNLGYALVALSFLVHDMVWLRAIAIVAGVLLTVASAVVGDWSPAFWNALFTAINLGWLTHLYLGERAVHFSDEERALYESIFAGMTRQEFLRLLRAGHWVRGEPGTLLAQEGQPLAQLVLLGAGAAKVEVGGKPMAELRDGHWVGEMSFLTRQPASATVTLTQATRYLVWSQEELAALFRRSPSMRLVVTQAMSGDLSRKLSRASQRRP